MNNKCHSNRLFWELENIEVNDRALLISRLPWYYQRNIKYDPIFAQLLDDSEIKIIADWFAETTNVPYIGDSGFIAVSFISELILSNEISSAIQLGHYAGFGSLVLGMMLRKVSPDARLISFDIDHKMNSYCNTWMKKAGLDDVVQHVCIDSTDPLIAELAGAHLKSNPTLVFIDASKQYHNTISEINLLSQYVDGYIISHDVSLVAKGEQANGVLGVSDGLVDSNKFAPNELILIDPKSENGDGFPYVDPCGLGIGIARGKAELPKNCGTIEEILERKRILDTAKLLHSENWFLQPGFAYEPGRLIKSAGSESWATCYAPVETGQRLRCEISISDYREGEILVCSGGMPGTSMTFTGNGKHVGEFVVGDENSLVGILGSSASAFSVDAIQVNRIADQ